MKAVQELNGLFSEQSLTSQFVPYGGAGAAGQAHTLVPLSKLPGDLPWPHSLCTDTSPASYPSHLSSAPKLRQAEAFAHPSSREPGLLHTPPQEVRGFVYSLK